MAEFRIFIYAVIGFFLGIVLFISGLSSFKRRRLIENIPTSKIRSLAMGLVEICGEAVPVKNVNLVSPFTNKHCAYYRYTIETLVSSGKSSHWVTEKKGHEGDHFFIRDDTGLVIVSTKGAKIDVGKTEFDSHYGKKPTENVMRFLKKHNIKHKTFLGFNKRMRFREYIIEPNDKLYAMGTAGDNPYVEDATTMHGVKDIMIQKGKNEKIFYISDKSEKGILKVFRWRIVCGIFGGGALIVGSLFVMLSYLRMF